MDYDLIRSQLCSTLQFQMLSKKDISNIRNQYMLSRSLHPNDYKSVMAWIAEAKETFMFVKLPDQSSEKIWTWKIFY